MIGGSATVVIAGSPLEVLDLGDRSDPAPVVLLHEGLGSIGAVALVSSSGCVR